MVDYTTYPVLVGQSKRFDCPQCGGKNTLCITNKDGKLLFCCFRASCNQRGIKKVGLKLENLSTVKALPPPALKVPDTWFRPDEYPYVVNWLKKVHCWDNKFTKSLYYDLSKRRVVFTSENSDGLLAVGRTLDRFTTPKWYVYPGSSKEPYQIRNGSDQCVIVEDAASAMAVSRFLEFDGIALIGTHLTQDAINVIIKYKKVLICLDKDASTKGLAHSKVLSPFMECRTILLNEDLRYLEDEDLYSILHL